MTSGSLDRQKPKLLVLASTYPRWHGDPEPSFVHELTKRLTPTFDVRVVCPASPGAASRQKMEGVDIVRYRYAPYALQVLVNNGGITTNLRRSPWKFLLVPGFIASMAWSTAWAVLSMRPNVVHAHWLIPQGLVAALLNRDRPLVVTSHGADLYAWRGSIFSFLKRFVLRRATTVTVVSQAMVQEVARLSGDSSRVQVAPMGVDLAGSFFPDDRVTRVPGLILFVGRLVEKKGLRHLIDAMPLILHRVPEAHLVVAGFGPEEAERKRQVDSLGMGDVVRFTGAVSHDKLPDMYRKASVFVSPMVRTKDGDQDGLGLVLVEAAACGCPVVASRLSVVRDIFDDGDAIFVDPDADAIAAAVIGVLHGHEKPDTDALTKKLTEQFDWSGVSDRYRTILLGAASDGNWNGES